MKKIIIIASIFIVVLIGFLIIFYPIKTDKFYLDDKYYNEGNFININSNDLNNINSNNYIVFTYNNYCNFEIPCDKIFQEFMKKYKIDILSIPYEDFKNTWLHNDVKYAPSIIIIKNKKVIKYLDAEKDEDIERYQDVNKFEQWLNEYINLSK